MAAPVVLRSVTPMLRTPDLDRSIAFYVDRLGFALQGKARTCYPPETFHYGMREFAVHDDNGYLLQFGAPA